MSNNYITQEANTDVGHEVGEHNIQVMGLDVHNPVFIVSAVLAVTVVLGTLLFLEQAAVLFADVSPEV